MKEAYGSARELGRLGLAAVFLLVACSSGGTTGDAGAISCGADASCTANQICVRTVTAGGVLLCPQDGGTCPDGYALDTTGCCSMMPSYGCASRPASCGATVTCACASTICTSGHTCSTPASGHEVDCTLLAP
jgi:hypothetical protein